MAHKETLLEIVDWVCIVQDRDKWWALLKSPRTDCSTPLDMTECVFPLN